MRDHGRIPLVGGVCGLRWVSRDGTDMHGCCLEPSHDGDVHMCSCDETMRVPH